MKSMLNTTDQTAQKEEAGQRIEKPRQSWLRKNGLTKSSLTNLTALALSLVGFFSPWQGELIRSAGLFALSGALTNWLAVFMLFERIPGLYGSGIIPLRFEQFREGIRNLIMNQFFTDENIRRFFQQGDCPGVPLQVDLSPILASLDYENLFQKLLAAANESPLGAMLAMVGGASALEPIKEPFITKMKEALTELSYNDDIQQAIRKTLQTNLGGQNMLTQVEAIVQRRLKELTPAMVKAIIQEMIHEHLGWLVVWGGVFGGLLGIVAALIP